MSKMDYEQKYKEALERARKLYNSYNRLVLSTNEIEEIFPELAESEDERIRRWLVELVENQEPKMFIEVKKMDIFAWLEKQKENPKTANSIPSDCVSSAKCEDRWYKVQDSTPADGRLVLAKDNIGNYLLASLAGGEWFVERYDLDDVPMKHTYVTEWCEIPSEKQKEPHYTKHNALFDECVAKCDPAIMQEVSDNVDKILEQKPVDEPFEKWLDDWYQGSKELGGDVVMSEKEFKNWSRGIRNMFEQKPAEWSEEEEINIGWLISYLKGDNAGEYYDEMMRESLADWLEHRFKSLKPQDYPLPEDTVLFNKGVAEGRRLEREDMPKWRKMPPGYEIRPANVCSIAVDLLDVNGKCCGQMGRTVLQNGEEYLFLDDLEKLPKE